MGGAQEEVDAQVFDVYRDMTQGLDGSRRGRVLFALPRGWVNYPLPLVASLAWS